MKKQLQRQTQLKTIGWWILAGLGLILFITAIVLLCRFENQYQITWNFYNHDLPLNQQVINWDINKWKIASLGMVILMTIAGGTLPFLIFWSVSNTEFKNKGK